MKRGSWTARILCSPFAYFLLAAALAPPLSAGTQGSAPPEKEKRPAELEALLASIQDLSRRLEEQREEIEGQRKALARQQERLDRLESLLALRASEGEAPAVAQAPPPQTMETLQRQLADTARATELLAHKMGNLSFRGDLRLRHEPTFGGTLPRTRNRERFRLRFHVDARLTDELSGGFSLSSGSESDPISGNQTMTDFYTRKPFAIDRAFVHYRPRGFKPFSLTAGKFGYTWHRTELTLDNDLNPEGISQTLSFDLESPLLENVTVVGFQLPFSESGNRAYSVMHGGQVQTSWRFRPGLRFGGYLAFYNWVRADPIRAAQTAGRLGGSANTNAATPAQFASNFALLDAIGRFDIDTGKAGWPLLLQFNFVSNTRACTNLSRVAGPAPACNPRDRHAYWMEAAIGRASAPNDVEIGYTFLRIEREAVLAAFNFSDIFASTNLITHRISLGYQLHRNVAFRFTGLFGRSLSTATSPGKERFNKRLQFDMSYKF